MDFAASIKLLGSRSKSFLITINVLIMLLVGAIDYLTGYDIALSLFYALPISFAAWFGGRQPGLVMSLLSLLTIGATDFMAGKVYGNAFAEFWNLLMHLGFFMLISILLSRLRIDFDEKRALIGELQQALADVKQLSGLLPICSSCKKIRDDRGYWNQLETYISRHSEAQFSHGICPDCVRKLYPDMADEILAKAKEESEKRSKGGTAPPEKV